MFEPRELPGHGVLLGPGLWSGPGPAQHLPPHGVARVLWYGGGNGGGMRFQVSVMPGENDVRLIL